MLSYRDFSRAWYGIGATGHPGKAYTKVVAKYAEPHRHYHTARHIEDCLAKIPIILAAWHYPNNGKPLPEATSRNIYELMMILITHDYYYDVLARDNEERSAKSTNAMLISGGVAYRTRRRIYDGTLATKPGAIPHGALERTASDIDISIFGASKEKFNQYDRVEIELEYPPTVVAKLANLPLDTEEDVRKVRIAYCVGRSNILKGYLNRPSIFMTDFFQELYEKQAKKNLTHAITRLESLKTELEK